MDEIKLGIEISFGIVYFIIRKTKKHNIHVIDTLFV